MNFKDPSKQFQHYQKSFHRPTTGKHTRNIFERTTKIHNSENYMIQPNHMLSKSSFNKRKEQFNKTKSNPAKVIKHKSIIRGSIHKPRKYQICRDSQEFIPFTRTKIQINKIRKTNRKSGVKSKFNFNKIKKMPHPRKRLNLHKFGHKETISPKRDQTDERNKLSDTNVFHFKDFSGTISKHSSIGRLKEINESDLMNVSAPVKISKYISSSQAKFNKKSSYQSNLFPSASPHNNWNNRNSITITQKMDISNLGKPETPKKLEATAQSISKAVKIGRKVQNKCYLKKFRGEYQLSGVKNTINSFLTSSNSRGYTEQDCESHPLTIQKFNRVNDSISSAQNIQKKSNYGKINSTRKRTLSENRIQSAIRKPTPTMDVLEHYQCRQQDFKKSKENFNMSGPLAINFFPKNTTDIDNLGKTATTAISPMNLSMSNSTKDKCQQKTQAKKTNATRNTKLLEHKKAKMNYENFKKRYTENKSCTSSKDSKRQNQESMRTRAKRFIENDFNFDYKPEGKPTKRRVATYSNQNLMKNSCEKTIPNHFTDLSFCTDGANPSHFDRYIVGKKIGQGAYAVVRAGIDSHTNQKVAIKVYDKINLKNPQKRKGVRREIKLLERMQHKNIIQLYEAFDYEDKVYLIMENVQGGSLHSLLKSMPNKQLKESDAKKLFFRIASAIEYCHSKSITHRDIKLENILLDESKTEVKLIDFGFSTCIPNEKKIKIFCGTPSYMAPEIVSKREFCGPPADIWALGVLLYALLCGKFPFKGKTDSELYSRISRGEIMIPDHVSDIAKSLLQKMIKIKPEERINASMILRDPWFTYNESSSKDVYRLNNTISNLSTLNTKGETRRTTIIDTSPYRDIDSSKTNDMPYEAYFPCDSKKMSKDIKC
ncbi:unnamed protein product [Moneuplotes crassus]|uniref:Protein kinase domain-containing protein n=1 Tax=Euplotes crassus TaxID=5936 RepID=A0AAD1Y0M9_EUPCR|nr:unnamed protein product [Moneuplotes crassus]